MDESKEPSYFCYPTPDCRDYHCEYNGEKGIVVVTQDAKSAMHEPVFVGAYAFQSGCLVECVAWGVMPDALCDMIEEKWGGTND